jgi:hypothetical protein
MHVSSSSYDMHVSSSYDMHVSSSSCDFCSRLVRHINCCALNDGLRIVTLDWHKF